MGVGDGGAGTGDRAWYRPDLQGLRALAVAVVVLYHLGVPGFSGGYVGVDVFFVISGYLISRLLVTEHDRSGTIDLRRFAARRVRRLLPVSSLVLVASMIALWLSAGPLRRAEERLVSVAASLFGANVGLAVQRTEYLTADREPLLQHYWSLGVEEQFYLLWPATLLLVLTVLARRGGGHRSRAVLVVVILSLAVLSLAYSVPLTARNRPFAFFLLPARAWQLLSGAALAAWELHGRTASARPALRMAGLALVGIATAGVLPWAFPWPLALLPTVGALLLIWAGVGAERHPRWLVAAPVTWIGDRSYGLYLWHWPPLVLLGLTATGFSDRPASRVAVLAGCVALTAGTYRWLEEPLRRGALLRSHRRVAAFFVSVTALSCGVAVAATALPGPGTPPPLPAASPSARPVPTPTAAPGADDPFDALPTVLPVSMADVPDTLPDALRASLASFSATPELYDNGCHTRFDDTEPLPSERCAYGVRGSATSIALVGDSHAAQWFEAARVAAETAGWELVVMTKSGCSLYDVDVTQGGTRPYPQCAQWQRATRERLAAEGFDAVVVAGVASPDHRAAPEEWARGVDRGLSALHDAVDAPLLVLLDPPHAPGYRPVPVCLEEQSVADCALLRDEAFDRVQRAAVAPWADAVVDTPSLVCDGDACPAVVGDVVVFRDDDHLSDAFSRGLAATFGRAVRSVLLDHGA